MKRRLKKYWKLVLVMLVVGFVLGLIGCDGTGVMGSPTVVIKADRHSTIIIKRGSITVTDGGTDAALRYKSDGHSPATTQPGL